MVEDPRDIEDGEYQLFDSAGRSAGFAVHGYAVDAADWSAPIHGDELAVHLAQILRQSDALATADDLPALMEAAVAAVRLSRSRPVTRKGQRQIGVDLLIAIDTRGLTLVQRERLAAALFDHARKRGFDQLSLELVQLKRAPESVGAGIESLARSGRKRGRWTVVPDPDSFALEYAQAAAPYVLAVNVLAGKELVAGTSDAMEATDLVVARTDWPELRKELQTILGTALVYDQAELRSRTE
jgi:hypothetical protein